MYLFIPHCACGMSQGKDKKAKGKKEKAFLTFCHYLKLAQVVPGLENAEVFFKAIRIKDKANVVGTF